MHAYVCACMHVTFDVKSMYLNHLSQAKSTLCVCQCVHVNVYACMCACVFEFCTVH